MVCDYLPDPRMNRDSVSWNGLILLKQAVSIIMDTMGATNIVGKLYKEFDSYKITSTVTAADDRKALDVGMQRVRPDLVRCGLRT